MNEADKSVKKPPTAQMTVTVHSQSAEGLYEVLKKILLEKARYI